ncbi:restriction endonuclease subunit S [Agrococcus sp. KRD186]|uniref:restriction endonuclease subunit S n=1 Tax=Agrococcus sp. KRD186 TaxID=2729730 RepID=UPI0019D21BCD|nr:restriction endonuclease subunit S [Agrococcus sp. KRD186]
MTAFRDGEVTLRSLRRSAGFTEAVQEHGYQGVRRGELVIHSMDAFAGAIGVSDSDGKMSPVAHIYSIPAGEPRYFALLLRIMAQRGYIESLAKGIRERSTSFDRATFRSLRLPVPPTEEQSRILRFLDQETAQIDAFIAKNEELVVLLAERRDSLWTELYDDAATAGRLVPVRRLVASIVDGPFGSSLTSAHYSTSGTRVIRLGNIGVNEFKPADEAFISTEYGAQLATHAARAGDVIVAGLGDERMPLGRACVLPDIGPAIVKADCYRVRPNRLVSAEYLAWILSAPPTRGQMRLLARGTTRLRLNTSVVRDVRVPVPSASLQAELVARFGGRSDKIDTAMSKAKHGIELARERRAALISAAVTGEIDVGMAV